jgi:type II secretory pathway pseudopilin PulG
MSLTRPVRARPRGYILLESLVGGSLLTIGLVVALGQVGITQRKFGEGSRRVQAMAVLNDGINRFRGMAYDSVPLGNREVNLAQANTYDIRRSITITNIASADCRVCKRVVVTVTFPTSKPGVRQTLRADTYLAPRP